MLAWQPASLLPLIAAAPGLRYWVGERRNPPGDAVNNTDIAGAMEVAAQSLGCARISALQSFRGSVILAWVSD
jgi:hypothetical protein